jgi:hypothetical protein
MHGINNNVKFVEAREGKIVTLYRNTKDKNFLKPLCSENCWENF